MAPQLIVEPDDGIEPVRAFIGSARDTLLIKQFTFTESSLVEATIERADAGVNVRVMLNAQRSGGTGPTTTPTTSCAQPVSTSSGRARNSM